MKLRNTEIHNIVLAEHPLYQSAIIMYAEDDATGLPLTLEEIKGLPQDTVYTVIYGPFLRFFEKRRYVVLDDRRGKGLQEDKK